MASIGSTEHKIVLQQAEAQVKDAIQLIPDSLKTAYTLALQKAPDLVANESNAVKFLRYCDYNVWQAAERLVRYWDKRVAYFGERAFLPMVQTGNGALSPADLVALHAGFFAPLPQTASGRDVLFVDRTKALQSASRETRLRCLFYIFDVLSCNERSQKEGILVCVLLITPRVTDFDHEFVQEGLNAVATAFPVKVEFHLLNCLPKSGKRAIIQTIVQAAVRKLIASIGPDNAHMHTEQAKNEILVELQRFGMHISGIPTTVGGNWKYEEFAKWCRKRVTAERLACRKQDNDGGMKSGTTMTLETSASAAKRLPAAVCTTDDPSSLDKNERKRLINVIHSRQKRERRKAEQTMLQQECQQLEFKKRRLLEEHERLQNLLSQARAIVAAEESGAGPELHPVENIASPQEVEQAPQATVKGAALEQQPRINRHAALQEGGGASIASLGSIVSNLGQMSQQEQAVIFCLLLRNNPQLACLMSEMNMRELGASVSDVIQQSRQSVPVIPALSETQVQQMVSTPLLASTRTTRSTCESSQQQLLMQQPHSEPVGVLQQQLQPGQHHSLPVGER